MSKDIKDYLHLYLGCEICWLDLNFQPTNNIEKLTSEVLNVIEHDVLWNDFKPILRPLSDIQPKEVANLIGVYDMAIEKANYESPFFQIQYRDENNELQYTHRYLTQLSPDQFHFLLSKHFDIFSLIDAGLALNKQSL